MLDTAANLCYIVPSMRLQWKEVPTEGATGQWAALYVTMNPKGQIALSRVTHEKMGEPKAYIVLFDAANNIIGLKPAALATRNARRACKKGDRGGRVVNVYRLIQDGRLSLPETIQFDAEIDHDGILQLDLRTAKASPRSANHPRNRRKASEMVNRRLEPADLNSRKSA
jgi:hypothetical protein